MSITCLCNVHLALVWDILPVSTAAQTAAGFEAVMGVLYIEVMIGSIVSGYHGR
jgi:hypothetical protein